MQIFLIFVLLDILWAFWICGLVSITNLGELSATITLNSFFCFVLYSPDIPVTNVIFWNVLQFLNVPFYFIFSIFSLYISVCKVSIHISLSSWLFSYFVWSVEDPIKWIHHFRYSVFSFLALIFYVFLGFYHPAYITNLFLYLTYFFIFFLNILTIVVFNYLSDNSKISIIYETGYHASFISLNYAFSCFLGSLVIFLLKAKYFV